MSLDSDVDVPLTLHAFYHDYSTPCNNRVYLDGQRKSSRRGLLCYSISSHLLKEIQDSPN